MLPLPSSTFTVTFLEPAGTVTRPLLEKNATPSTARAVPLLLIAVTPKLLCAIPTTPDPPENEPAVLMPTTPAPVLLVVVPLTPALPALSPLTPTAPCPMIAVA